MPYAPKSNMSVDDAPASGRPLSLDYLPQLDGLRAVACLAVMFSHFVLPPHLGPLDFLPWGPLGVQFFFVLSGFLITRLLLDARQRAEQGTTPYPRMLRQFFFRRLLRLLPPYYVLLAILFLLHYDGLRPAFWWHALLVMNFWRAITGAQLLNHLWAVAVEFQFYLFWPLVIFLVPRRRLRLVVTLLAVSAPCFRFAAWYAGGGQPVITLLPFGNLDALSAGALLALRKTPAGDPPPSAYSRAAAWEPGSAGIPAGQACHIAYFRAGMWGSGSAGIPAGQACHIAYSRAGMWGGLALLAGVALVRVFALADYPAQAVVLGSALALLYFHVLQRALQGFRGPLGNLLSHRATCHLGMISYSTYLFHPLIGRLFLWLHAAYGLPWPESPWLQLPLLIAASIAAAQLSWMFLEKPLARLKSRF